MIMYFIISQKYSSETNKLNFWVPLGTFFGSLFGCAEALVVFQVGRCVSKHFFPFLGCQAFLLLACAELGHLCQFYVLHAPDRFKILFFYTFSSGHTRRTCLPFLQTNTFGFGLTDTFAVPRLAVPLLS